MPALNKGMLILYIKAKNKGSDRGHCLKNYIMLLLFVDLDNNA
jgi:hypothetical protein